MSDNQTLAIGSYEITVVITSPPWYENCCLVRHMDSGDLVIVDPGGDAERIAAAATDSGGTLREIWFTHGHPDHIGGAKALQDRFGVSCRAHEAEAPVIENAPDFASALGNVSLDLPEDLSFFSGEPMIEAEQVRCKVLHTPGHTPGGVCFLFDGFALTGDTLFNHGIGRTDFPGGDGHTLSVSITRLLETVPEETVLFSGHGSPWQAGEAKHWWEWMV